MAKTQSVDRDIGSLIARVDALEHTDKLLCEQIRSSNDKLAAQIEKSSARLEAIEVLLHRVGGGFRLLSILGFIAGALITFAEKIGLTKLLWGK